MAKKLTNFASINAVRTTLVYNFHNHNLINNPRGQREIYNNARLKNIPNKRTEQHRLSSLQPSINCQIN